MKIPFSPDSIPAAQVVRASFVFGVLILGQWALSDFVHLPGGGLGLVCVGAGFLWLSKPVVARFDSPDSLQGWIRRCRTVLDQFEDLDQELNALGRRKQREEELNELIDRSGPQSLAVIGPSVGGVSCESLISSGIPPSIPLDVVWSPYLSSQDDSWVWPNSLQRQDALLYLLPLPLMAVDLLWLGKVPDEQPSWLVVSWPDSLSWHEQMKSLKAQLPHRWSDRVLRIGQQSEDFHLAFAPVRRLLSNPKRNIDSTKQRLLKSLHGSWQGELECLRRKNFSVVQKRAQWIVAGAVFASPVATTDLLAVAVVNGLMINEMAKIWSCSWSVESLKAVARQLAGAAVAQGVVEWSGQALLGAAKLDGSSWLAAGTLQALSAAYLTRVVGRSMADWLALNNGVSELDLEALKSQTNELVANAAEQERLDWQGFLNQASCWLGEFTKQRTMFKGLLEA